MSDEPPATSRPALYHRQRRPPAALGPSPDREVGPFRIGHRRLRGRRRRHAASLGVRPDLILGDLDSLHGRRAGVLSAARRSSGTRTRRAPTSRRRSSTALAAGCGTVVVIGAVGDRIDHSTGALGCLPKYGRRLRLRVLDRSGELRLPDRSETIGVRARETFSLIPLGRCQGDRPEGRAISALGGITRARRQGGPQQPRDRDTVVDPARIRDLLLYRFPPDVAARGAAMIHLSVADLAVIAIFFAPRCSRRVSRKKSDRSGADRFPARRQAAHPAAVS